MLLRLPREQASELYSEVVERIEANYVDRVPFEPLVRHGLDNLEVALRDPVFLKNNSLNADPDRVTWLRDSLRAYRAVLAIPDREAALQMALPAPSWRRKRSACPRLRCCSNLHMELATLSMTSRAT